jgi:hypothetical protein
MRTLAEINDDIDRCNWLRDHMHDLSEVFEQDRVLVRLRAERDAAVAQGVAA